MTAQNSHSIPQTHVSLRRRTTSLDQGEECGFGVICGSSRVMCELFAVLTRVADSEVNVLLEGESGTGKELVAAELGRRGTRAAKPFVVVDCGSIAPSLIESELFGHCRGAFTGAERDRTGAFEAAHGGTLFLDEIGELPRDMQPKLLRALEASEIRRVGETASRTVDVRIIAATNRNLEREVARGAFREDLFYRLAVVNVRLPPLRERLEDLEPLVGNFLRILSRRNDSPPAFTPEMFDALRRHDWPGNVRELRNYVERYLVLGSTPAPGSAPAPGRAAPGPAKVRATHGALPEGPDSVTIDCSFRDGKERVVAEFERVYVTKLIRWADGNLSLAARKAQMDRVNLYRVLQRHGLRAQIRGEE